MNRNKLKTFVTKILLEKLENLPSIQGSLIKKIITFRGIERTKVCEGTIADANEYANKNGLVFNEDDDSHFGGHYTGEVESYEFHPNPEFYGEMMETSLSAREQYARICGTNDQVLTEINKKLVDSLVEYIFTNEEFASSRTQLVSEQIKNSIIRKMYDKTQYVRLVEYLIKQASFVFTNNKFDLSEVDHAHAVEVITKKIFDNIKLKPSLESSIKKCGKKSFKEGSAIENMQRIMSGHQMFL